jgi:hypothetical protein
VADVRCFSASVGDMTVIVSSVIGNGPVVNIPAAAAELLPAAVLAPPTPLLTTPAESMGTAMTPKVAWPDAAMPKATALLACVLEALAFCALSAAFTLAKLIKLTHNTKISVCRCGVIDSFLVRTKRFGEGRVINHMIFDKFELPCSGITTCAELNHDFLVQCQINSKLALIKRCWQCGELAIAFALKMSAGRKMKRSSGCNIDC